MDFCKTRVENRTLVSDKRRGEKELIMCPASHVWLLAEKYVTLRRKKIAFSQSGSQKGALAVSIRSVVVA
jgi:hypothetical protein